MYLNRQTLINIQETSYLIEEFFWKKNKTQVLKLPENKVKLIAEDAKAKQLIRNPKFVKQVKNYLGVEYYKTEKEKEELLRKGTEIRINVKEASDDAKFTLENTDNFPKDKKEQEKIIKIFFNRFIPFYSYGNGDQLAWDKKRGKLVDILHERSDYKTIVTEPNTTKTVKWI